MSQRQYLFVFAKKELVAGENLVPCNNLSWRDGANFSAYKVLAKVGGRAAEMKEKVFIFRFILHYPFLCWHLTRAKRQLIVRLPPRWIILPSACPRKIWMRLYVCSSICSSLFLCNLSDPPFLSLVIGNPTLAIHRAHSSKKDIFLRQAKTTTLFHSPRHDFRQKKRSRIQRTLVFASAHFFFFFVSFIYHIPCSNSRTKKPWNE